MEATLPIGAPLEVGLHQSPWVAGTRATAQRGRVWAEIFVDDREPDRRRAWDKAHRELLESVRDRARARGANAVVGLELCIDPFACGPDGDGCGVRFTAEGAAVVLEALDSA